MTDILPFLKSLISVSGLSGYETPVADLIAEKWRPLVDETSMSRVGSLHGLKKGRGKTPRPSVMIAAHMDAIGLRVSKVVAGFLRITNVGGIDVRVLPGCLEELQNKPHVWDVWAVATVQEEVTFLGASSSAFELRPQIAIVVDGAFAKSPGANGWQTFPLAKGVGLCIGPNMHPFLHKQLSELAERLEIPWFLDVTPSHSGTDAFAVQTTAEGIPTALVEYPLRYMHTPVEMVAVKDIQRVGRLLAEFISSLEADFVDTIVWE